MKITSLHVYPIKGLRGISLPSTLLTPLGIPHDRTFMLFELKPDATLTKIQIDSHPRCARFWQEIIPSDSDSDQLAITFRDPDSPAPSEDTLTIPLTPALPDLSPITVSLHGSPAAAYRMPDAHATWFGARLGVPVVFVYLGDGRREVLGSTLRPPAAATPAPRGWLSSVTSYLGGSAEEEKPPAYLTFTDAGALLVTSEVSLHEINTTRLPADSPTGMFKFRPNVVVDGEGEEAWAEDFWGELEVGGTGDGRRNKVLLTGNCVRCMSLNVDYETGKMATGELGTVLKKLARDRRVDPGHRWSPVFGRYGFPVVGEGEGGGFVVGVGDEVMVTRRNEERTRWDWPGM
ncbi:hypothetical protein B0T18DRAFT_423564 [Schizothecium vesticola]|uniref:MOSC domain-containing protein n=1 Tax=Schizothecium vesticola TaxID=314040 RepID=A0AA40F881_9PEZI|nr:hypothetical protein B0T18DRAFT_423564 [Schizothecium vesticola]